MNYGDARILIVGLLRCSLPLARSRVMVYTSYMPKRSSKKREADANQLAKAIVDEATDESRPSQDTQQEAPAKNPAAVALGRLGGKKGGPARAKKLSKARRTEIAKKAAQSRWQKDQSSSVESAVDSEPFS